MKIYILMVNNKMCIFWSDKHSFCIFYLSC